MALSDNRSRIYKQEENIPDAPDELLEAIAGIETVTVQAEERKEILIAEEPFTEPKPRKQTPVPGTESQLPLF